MDSGQPAYHASTQHKNDIAGWEGSLSGDKEMSTECKRYTGLVTYVAGGQFGNDKRQRIRAFGPACSFLS